MVEFDPILVHDWLSRSAQRFPDKEALICGDQRWTYKMLDHYTFHLATVLRGAGIQRGDRVVIFLGNCSEAVISLYGILKAGAVFSILEGSIKANKLKYILKNSEARAIITHSNKTEIVCDALDSDIKPTRRRTVKGLPKPASSNTEPGPGLENKDIQLDKDLMKKLERALPAGKKFDEERLTGRIAYYNEHIGDHVKKG